MIIKIVLLSFLQNLLALVPAKTTSSYQEVILMTVANYFQKKQLVMNITEILSNDTSLGDPISVHETFQKLNHLNMESNTFTRPGFYSFQHPVIKARKGFSNQLFPNEDTKIKDFLKFESFVLRNESYTLFRIDLLKWLISTYISQLFVLSFNDEEVLKSKIYRNTIFKGFYNTHISKLLVKNRTHISNKLSDILIEHETLNKNEFSVIKFEKLNTNFISSKKIFDKDVVTFKDIIAKYIELLMFKTNDSQGKEFYIYEGLYYRDSVALSRYQTHYGDNLQILIQNAMSTILSTIYFMVKLVKETIMIFEESSHHQLLKTHIDKAIKMIRNIKLDA